MMDGAKTVWSLPFSECDPSIMPHPWQTAVDFVCEMRLHGQTLTEWTTSTDVLAVSSRELPVVSKYTVVHGQGCSDCLESSMQGNQLQMLSVPRPDQGGLCCAYNAWDLFPVAHTRLMQLASEAFRATHVIVPSEKLEPMITETDEVIV